MSHSIGIGTELSAVAHQNDVVAGERATATQVPDDVCMPLARSPMTSSTAVTKRLLGYRRRPDRRLPAQCQQAFGRDGPAAEKPISAIGRTEAQVPDCPTGQQHEHG